MDWMENAKVTSQTQDPCENSPTNPPKDAPEKRSKLRNKGKTHPRFLGVRQRPSGRWVAEIKDSPQKLRLWLGTFDRAEEAAMAYDSAARLLRGRNARTNFPFNEMNMNHEGKCSLILGNARFHQLLHHAFMKTHAKLSSVSAQNLACLQKGRHASDSSDFSVCVHETIVCSSQRGSGSGCEGNIEDRDGFCGFSLGSSKVYSTVHVAPSFSASFYQCRGEEKKCEEAAQSNSNSSC